MRTAVTLIVVLGSLVPGAASQSKWPTPNWDKPKTMEDRVCGDEIKKPVYGLGDYQLRLVLVPDQEFEHMCRAYLADKEGNQKLLLEDFRILVHQGTGEDVFGNGHPTIVLEGWSGGAHCCYTYSLVDLAPTPHFVPNIENETGFFFFKDQLDGRYRVLTYDGAFDYFDGMCHACSPFPHVVLEVNTDGVMDVSSKYLAEYDAEIAEVKAKVNQEELGRFLTVPEVHRSNESTYDDLRQHVLQIVLSYLYSGREAQAWQILDAMWPASDKARIKKLILDTKREGLLSRLGGAPIK